jgi:biopolymer transport protein ExbB/TolQ
MIPDSMDQIAPPSAGSGDALLSWNKGDPEQRLGFRGGRYTNPNKTLGMLSGLLLSIAFYAILINLAGWNSWLAAAADIFSNRGLTQHAAVFLFFTAAAMLWMKSRKLAFQKKAFELPIMPADASFGLSPETARAVMERLQELADSPSQFAVLGRVERALSNLDNIGHAADVTAILKAQSENDEAQVAASYVIIQGFAWAIPVLGFIGTVVGLSRAIGAFGLTLQREGDFEGIKESLTFVTSGLATAFDTTLVALVLALLLQLLISMLQSNEADWLDACNEYCTRKVTGRLRLRDAA